MMMAGIFQALAGIAAIANVEFFVIAPNYTFHLDTSAWGCVHLIIGVLVALAAIALFVRQAWAGMVAIVFAMFSAISNFFFIPYYPWWALLVIALDVFVIWALTR